MLKEEGTAEGRRQVCLTFLEPSQLAEAKLGPERFRKPQMGTHPNSKEEDRRRKKGASSPRRREHVP